MGWSIGYDSNWERDIGYSVPALCDHPDCDEEIDRGLAYVCGSEPFGGEQGCGLHFCGKHLFISRGKPQLCEKCINEEEPFKPKPDVKEWVEWKLNDASWEEWRQQNPEKVATMQQFLITEKEKQNGNI